MSKLFSPYELKGKTIKNRLVMAPMCMYSAENGLANDWHLTHYLTRAVGGVGTIVVEATGVLPEGRITEQDLGLWDDSQLAPLNRIVAEVRKYDCLIGIQLNHAGRKSQTNGTIFAPSPLAFETMQLPAELTKADIRRVVESFRQAAIRADCAGFDFIQIHGAHGYLINQFLSPLANKRTDEYGGCLPNRTRFLHEIIEAIGSVWPKEKILSLRVSAEEYHPEGNHVDDLCEIINSVKDSGIDWVDVSSGGVVNAKINAYPGYQLPFAQTIKEKTNLPVTGGGLICTVGFAEKALNDLNLDFIYMGRELLRNPYIVLNQANELGFDPEWPFQYKRAKNTP